jgi:hypothetical protein
MITVTDGGKVGFGVDTPLHVNASLEFASGAMITTGGSFIQASRRALKEEIAPLSLEDAVSAVNALDPVTFKYKANGEFHIGFIAEDVPALLAGNLTAAESERKGLSALDFVAALVKVVQSHEQEIRSFGSSNARRNAMVGELKHTIEVMSKLVTLGNATVQATADSIQVLESDISALRMEIHAHQKSLSTLRTKFSSNQILLQQQQSTIRSLQQDIAAVNETEANDELTALEQQVAADNANLSNLLRQLSMQNHK